MGQHARSIDLLRLSSRPVLEFLYPAISRPGILRPRSVPLRLTRRVHSAERRSENPHPDVLPAVSILDLPRSCPGCGAFTQNTSPDGPGFYSQNRRSVKTYLGQTLSPAERESRPEDAILNEALAAADPSLRAQLGFGDISQQIQSQSFSNRYNDSSLQDNNVFSLPVCDRCHRLLHHHSNEPATHITVQSVHNILQDSPHKHNHIYHVLDAADFPLSLIPSLQKTLSLSPQRSRNRRAATSHYQGGRKADITYIITRSDLLAPTKDQVDKLMPYLVQVLRDAIGGSAEHVRLGNVRCVSSKRGWWTRSVKEDIWKRGGAGWMVGKANVGKSSLLETVFPKGHSAATTLDHAMAASEGTKDQRNPMFEKPFITSPERKTRWEDEILMANGSLLPPAQVEQDYPTLPIVSNLPGTTAAPIRNVFGSGKGELIDLPGLNRGDLHSFVVEQNREKLVMDHRIKTKQLTIKPGQSLLVGGLITITPMEPDVVFLAYPFVPMPTHVTSRDKAKVMIEQESFPEKTSIARPGISRRMLHAGTFPLKWDVTRDRAGPLTRKSAVGLSTKVLPFVVVSVDILVEGCGWIELVAQVRKRSLQENEQSKSLFDTTPYPLVEIMSPDGGYVGVRKPMGAALLGASKPGAKAASRPRPGMRGMKKHLKKIAREKASQSRPSPESD